VTPARKTLTRRDFIASSALMLGTAVHGAVADPPEEVIDIHQHTNYAGRSDEDLIRHQRGMGITKTLLLPSGRVVKSRSTHFGRSNGLAARCGGNESVAALVAAHPDEFLCGANDVPDLPDSVQELEKWLKRGARIIAEQKFSLPSASPDIQKFAEVARDYQVPMLLHFQVGEYNLGFENFWRILEAFPTVNFIGHAQTWWSCVDEYWDGESLYPKGSVVPGGLTDRYLSNNPNMYGDLSAGSGLNFLLRDEAHARWFLHRHQDRLLFGSDCDDRDGGGPQCQGAQTLATLRRLLPKPEVRRKILYGNAKRLLKI
jgi:predicted TIM-barrel fold metal-dependent hydrolase